MRLLGLALSCLLGLLVYAAIGALADGQPLSARDLGAVAIIAIAAVLLAGLAVSDRIVFWLRRPPAGRAADRRIRNCRRVARS
jgi:hypothetical protein